MRCARHAASTGWIRILSENLKRRNHMEGLGADWQDNIKVDIKEMV
jgi:hypothetical protein